MRSRLSRAEDNRLARLYDETLSPPRVLLSRFLLFFLFLHVQNQNHDSAKISRIVNFKATSISYCLFLPTCLLADCCIDDKVNVGVVLLDPVVALCFVLVLINAVA